MQRKQIAKGGREMNVPGLSRNENDQVIECHQILVIRD